MSSRLVAGVAIALLALAVAATRHASPRPLAQKCGTNTYGVAAAPFWLAAADGVHLYALETGGGKVGVVLLHESPADLCGWLPFMPVLSRAGFRVLAFDFRGFGDSDRPQKTSDFLAYGPDIHDLYRQVGTMARKVLQGAKVAELPVERPTRFQLVANLRTAKQLGITLPPSILLRADEVIE